MMQDLEIQTMVEDLVQKIGVSALSDMDFSQLHEILPKELDPDALELIVEKLFDLQEIQEEKERASLEDVSNSLRGYVLQVGQVPRLSRDEEEELLECLSMGQEHARERLIEGYLPMVLNIAREKGRTREEILEYIQEGNIALLKAVQSFDPHGGKTLRDYIRWRIRKGINRFQQKTERSVRIPKKLASFFHDFREKVAHMKIRLNRAPQLDEIAQELELDLEQVRRNLLMGAPLFEGEQQLDEKDRSFLSYVRDVQTIEEMELTPVSNLSKILAEHLEILDPVEREIIVLHYALEEQQHPLDIYEIADELGLKSNHVRDLKTAAITKVTRFLGKMETI